MAVKATREFPASLERTASLGDSVAWGPIRCRAMNTHLSFSNGLGSGVPSPAHTRYTHTSLQTMHLETPEPPQSPTCIRQHIRPSLNNDICFPTLVTAIVRQFLFTCIPVYLGIKSQKADLAWAGMGHTQSEAKLCPLVPLEEELPISCPCCCKIRLVFH